MFLTILGLSIILPLFPIVILTIILKPRLNPIFDPMFQKKLDRLVGLVSVTRRFARTGMYSGGIVMPVIRKNHFNNYDMKAQVSKNTYRLCLINIILGMWSGILALCYWVYLMVLKIVYWIQF